MEYALPSMESRVHVGVRDLLHESLVDPHHFNPRLGFERVRPAATTRLHGLGGLQEGLHVAPCDTSALDCFPGVCAFCPLTADVPKETILCLPRTYRSPPQ